MPIVESQGRSWFELRHLVCFAETNLVGNVYYSNHIAWQGRCREMFLRECCPDVLDVLPDEIVMVTLSVSCEYHRELFAFDDVALRMRVVWQRQNRMALTFDYLRVLPDGEEQIAQGEQQLACLARTGDAHEPCAFPNSMLSAIKRHGLAATTPGWGIAI